MGKLQTWEKWVIGIGCTGVAFALVYYFYKKSHPSNTTASPTINPDVCGGGLPYVAPQTTNTTTTKTPVVPTVPVPINKQMPVSAQRICVGHVAACTRVSSTQALSQQDIAIGTVLLFNFLFTYGDTDAQSLQKQYFTALSSGDATQMMSVYFACADELKSQYYKKFILNIVNPSQKSYYQNGFDVIYQQAKSPNIYSNGLAVSLANQMINFINKSSSPVTANAGQKQGIGA